MLNENETFQVSDERNNDRLHQQHRYANKTIRRTNQIVRQDTSCLSKRPIVKHRRHVLAKTVRGEVSCDITYINTIVSMQIIVLTSLYFRFHS